MKLLLGILIGIIVVPFILPFIVPAFAILGAYFVLTKVFS